MPSFVGQFAVSAGQDTPVTIGQGGLSALLIGNASGLTLVVKMGGNYSRSLYAGQVDKFPIPATQFTGVVTFSAKTALGVNNAASYPSSYVQIDAIGIGEQVEGTYPMQLNLPAVNSTASGNPIFSATFGVGSTAGTIQSLNIYNPANSGVSYQFHSARFYTTNAATGDFASLILIPGADLNLSNAVTVVSHDCGSNPPVSVAHATGQDDSTGHGGTTIEIYDSVVGSTLDFLAFPDLVILRPGNNLRVALLTTGATGKVARLTMKWTEVPQVAMSAGIGGATTGNILTASNVINDGNTPGTGVISAYPSGLGGVNQLFIDNNGNITALGNALLGSILGASGIKGSLHLGQITSGDTFDSDVNGNTYFKSIANSNQSINFQPVNGTTTAFFGTAGLTFDSGGITFVGLGVINRVNTFTANVTTTPTLFNHGLGVVPNRIMYIIQGTGTGAASVQYDTATLSSSQIKLTGSGTFTALVTVFG